MMMSIDNKTANDLSLVWRMILISVPPIIIIMVQNKVGSPKGILRYFGGSELDLFKTTGYLYQLLV